MVSVVRLRTPRDGACRRRLQCEDAFPEIYDKIRPEAGILDLAEEEAAEAAALNGHSYRNGHAPTKANGNRGCNGSAEAKRRVRSPARKSK